MENIYGEGKSLSFLDVDAKVQLNETMDKELAEKHEAIEKGRGVNIRLNLECHQCVSLTEILAPVA